MGITLEDVENVIISRKKTIIINCVTKYYGSIYSFRHKDRKRENVFARQLYFYFMKKHTRLSLDTIGETEGNTYHHANVLHAIKNVKDLVDTNKEISYIFNKIAGDVYMKINEMLKEFKEESVIRVELNNSYVINFNGRNYVFADQTYYEVEKISKKMFDTVVEIKECENTDSYLVTKKQIQ